MIVMILEKVPVSLRGELTRWLIEPHTGVFVGHVSAMVRDQLWQKCSESRFTGGVVQLWPTNNEQHFAIRMAGDTKRRCLSIEGVNLVSIPEKKDPDLIKPP
jgi:CRISPR-associated protein Cas2